jgi:long-chain fatty acid transport protein
MISSISIKQDVAGSAARRALQRVGTIVVANEGVAMRRIWGMEWALAASASMAAMVAAGAAHAGGFALREQSTEFQGTSFAGNGAGGELSSMFWNPAATAAKNGMNTESAYTFIVPEADLHVTGVSGATAGVPASAGGYAGANPDSGNIAHWALLPSFYANYQLTDQLFLGVASTSAFGLVTKPEDQTYQGATLARTTKLTTYDLNPTIGYKVTPWLTIGAGVQIEYAKATLRFATAYPGDASSSFEGQDVAFGATAGVLITPARGTTLGVGWRSQVTHTLEGSLTQVSNPAPAYGYTGTGGAAIATSGSADLKLPDIVTVSVRQEVAPNLRLLGTFEWSNWSRLNQLQVVAAGTGASLITLPTNWQDGYMISVGGEYDYNAQTTLRTGVAYEWSSVQSSTERILQDPDNNRVWLSFGASYKWSEWTTVSFAYSHLFIEDGTFTRSVVQLSGTPLATTLTGTETASTDIVSVGLKHKW